VEKIIRWRFSRRRSYSSSISRFLRRKPNRTALSSEHSKSNKRQWRTGRERDTALGTMTQRSERTAIVRMPPANAYRDRPRTRRLVYGKFSFDHGRPGRHGSMRQHSATRAGYVVKEGIRRKPREKSRIAGVSSKVKRKMWRRDSIAFANAFNLLQAEAANVEKAGGGKLVIRSILGER